MRNDNIWIMAVCIILFLAFCVAMMESETHKLIAIVAAGIVACVYMECESRVQRAYAPLVIREEPVPEKTKPPELAED